MPEPILKNCFNCRMKLPDGCTNIKQCPKCEKNEQKYGTPGTCTYCKLNAAFHEKKCVWCSHAERKCGLPLSCANCKLKSAFPRRDRDKVEGALLLCRLCIAQARENNMTVMSGVPVPPERPERESGSGSSGEHRDRRHRSDRHHHHHSSSRSHRDSRTAPKRRHEESSSSSSAQKQANNENGGVSNGFPPFGERDQGDNIVKQQKMEDEIRRLKSIIAEKDGTLFDKDKQISSLKADVYNMEKKHRERVHQLNKEKEESIRAIELMRTSKSSKKN